MSTDVFTFSAYGAKSAPYAHMEGEKLAQAEGLHTHAFWDGSAFLACSERFNQSVSETEMLIDLHKCETAKEWVYLMLLRFVERAGAPDADCTVWASIKREEADDGL